MAPARSQQLSGAAPMKGAGGLTRHCPQLPLGPSAQGRPEAALNPAPDPAISNTDACGASRHNFSAGKYSGDTCCTLPLGGGAPTEWGHPLLGATVPPRHLRTSDRTPNVGTFGLTENEVGTQLLNTCYFKRSHYRFVEKHLMSFGNVFPRCLWFLES